MELSAPAVRLLIDIARQLDGRNNGRLVACMSVMQTRGWTSNDTLTRARRELQAAGLLFQTRIGMRPNRAAWYAVTWLELNWTSEMECSPSAFPRGQYLHSAPSKKRSA